MPVEVAQTEEEEEEEDEVVRIADRSVGSRAPALVDRLGMHQTRSLVRLHLIPVMI